MFGQLFEKLFEKQFEEVLVNPGENGNSRSPREEHQCTIGTVATFYLNRLKNLKKIIHPFGNIADRAREYGRTSI